MKKIHVDTQSMTHGGNKHGKLEVKTEDKQLDSLPPKQLHMQHENRDCIKKKGHSAPMFFVFKHQHSSKKRVGGFNPSEQY